MNGENGNESSEILRPVFDVAMMRVERTYRVVFRAERVAKDAGAEEALDPKARYPTFTRALARRLAVAVWAGGSGRGAAPDMVELCICLRD